MMTNTVLLKLLKSLTGFSVLSVTWVHKTCAMKTNNNAMQSPSCRSSRMASESEKSLSLQKLRKTADSDD